MSEKVATTGAWSELGSSRRVLGVESPDQVVECGRLADLLQRQDVRRQAVDLGGEPVDLRLVRGVGRRTSVCAGPEQVLDVPGHNSEQSAPPSHGVLASLYRIRDVVAPS